MNQIEDLFATIREQLQERVNNSFPIRVKMNPDYFMELAQTKEFAREQSQEKPVIFGIPIEIDRNVSTYEFVYK